MYVCVFWQTYPAEMLRTGKVPLTEMASSIVNLTIGAIPPTQPMSLIINIASPANFVIAKNHVEKLHHLDHRITNQEPLDK
ncbi:hypothetical protein BC941DRAFT_424678 [Chlamydoabsidia padenii]|nr:hypothetical protein BC941DRAFT_424678 [Chlamydoabsidia padenii]